MGICTLCRHIAPVLNSLAEKQLVGTVIREIWESRGLQVETTQEDLRLAALGGPGEAGDDEEESEDLWLSPLVTWLAGTPPPGAERGSVTVEAAAAALGLDGDQLSQKVRTRLHGLLKQLGHKVGRKRFDKAPAHVAEVSAFLARFTGPDLTIAAVIEGLGWPHDHREIVLIGRCLAYLGYRAHRFRIGRTKVSLGEYKAVYRKLNAKLN